MLHKFTFLLVLLYFVAWSSGDIPKDVKRPQLRGVTILQPPFMDSRKRGFSADMIKAISQKVGFDYQLYLVSEYGTVLPNGTVTGLVGEVFYKRADFAVADLTVTEQRAQYVDFSTVFMTSQFSAMIRAEDGHGMATLDDLAAKKRSDPKSFLFGSVAFDEIPQQLANSSNRLGREIYDWLQANPSGQVDTLQVGLDKVAQGGFALLTESTVADWAVGQDCRNFTVLHDVQSLMVKPFANALQQGSPYLDKFNQATQELIQDGTVQQWISKYWANNCK